MGRALYSTNKTYILSMNSFAPGLCLAGAHDLQHSPVWFPSTVHLWEKIFTENGTKLCVPPVFQDRIFKTPLLGLVWQVQRRPTSQVLKNLSLLLFIRRTDLPPWNVLLLGGPSTYSRQVRLGLHKALKRHKWLVENNLCASILKEMPK